MSGLKNDDTEFEKWVTATYGDKWPNRIKKDDEGYLDQDTKLRKQGWDAATAILGMKGKSARVVPNTTNDFEEWWDDYGSLCRSGGGAYEKTFAWNAWAHLVEKWNASIEETTCAVEDTQVDSEEQGLRVMHQMVLTLGSS